MSHLAFVAPPFRGHLDPMLALAGTLRGRGHRVTLFGIPDVQPVAVGGGCDAVALGERSHPPGTLATLSNRLAAPGGLGLFRVMADMTAMTRMLCDALPAACRAEGVDAIVSDQLEPAGALVAAHLGLPSITVANALPIHREPGVPPPFTSWRYDPTARGLKRNRGGYRVSDALMRPVTANIAREAARLGVAGRRSLDACLSSLAEITQLVPALDFPRRHLGGHVHPCGPLRVPMAAGAEIDLPDDGRPLVFASLGSLQGGRAGLFRRIAQACAALDLSLVIAHGGRLDAREVARLPGHPIVRAFVPQRSLLRRVDLLVT
ncbi:MAG: glycosyltransferase, partial [Caulobacteraceae bacterium]|nr:glycosyltransferase [Caulobacter sp.]